jgi:hypothetical protein
MVNESYAAAWRDRALRDILKRMRLRTAGQGRAADRCRSRFPEDSVVKSPNAHSQPNDQGDCREQKIT